MVSLADSLGMQDYHTLYDDGVNAALKTTRPNPNQLLINDDWTDPPAKGKIYDKAVDQTHTFVVKPKKLPHLRILLLNGEGKPLGGKAWTMTAPKALTGKTKDDGIVQVPDLPPQDKAGDLKVTWQQTKPLKPLKPEEDKEVKKPTYPRPIKASEFTDDLPEAPKASDDVIDFTLKIGSLPTINDDSGIRGRLHNLGAPCVLDSDADTTKKAVKAYQIGRLKQKTPSGVLGDIKNDARDRHDG
jgi:hypothetical protein